MSLRSTSFFLSQRNLAPTMLCHLRRGPDEFMGRRSTIRSPVPVTESLGRASRLARIRKRGFGEGAFTKSGNQFMLMIGLIYD